MRLLQLQDASSFNLVEFLGSDVPPYAILSHTWGPSNEEVTYQDLLSGTGKEKKGYRKLTFCGEQAAKDGLHHFWIDTCCIDKSSSAELSEAINSMYFWYSNANVCYAYLSDMYQIEDSAVSLKDSTWFTRGWTLQEFLAPKKVEFYSAQWKPLGNKDELKNTLHEFTKIPIEALEGTALNHFSIAERMSWASERLTTRIEDIAYSLMGIFDINMPLLYGEREKAFLRLQQHILQTSSDQSLFAWKDPSLKTEDEVSIFARSPKQFEHSNSLKPIGAWTRHDSSMITYNGLHIELWLIPTDDDERVYLASLACSVGSSYHHSPGIYLKRISGFRSSWRANPKTQFVRVHGDKLEELKSVDKINGQHSTVHVLQEPKIRGIHDPIPLDMIIFDIGWQWGSCPEICEQFVGFQVFPTTSWNPQTHIFTAKRDSGALGAIFTQHKDTSTITIFGVSLSGEPWVSTLSRPPFAPHEWSTFKLRGTETATSQVVISESLSGSVACKATIWTNRTQRYGGRDVFVILVAGKIVTPPHPNESASEARVMVTARSRPLLRDDPMPADGG